MKFLNHFLCLTVCFAAHAGVYKWTDANGKVHFGDQPPPKVESKQVKVHQSQGLSGPTAGSTTSNTTGKQPDQTKAPVDPNRLAQCAVLKANLSNIQLNKRLKLIEEDGSSKRLDSNERDDHIRKLEEQIAQACAGV